MKRVTYQVFHLGIIKDMVREGTISPKYLLEFEICERVEQLISTGYTKNKAVKEISAKYEVSESQIYRYLKIYL